MSTPQIILVHPVRTELGAIATGETPRRAGLASDRIDSVIMGNVMQAGNRMNPARQAAIGAGLPVTVPVLTVNRVCGSGARMPSPPCRLLWHKSWAFRSTSSMSMAARLPMATRSARRVPFSRRGRPTR